MHRLNVLTLLAAFFLALAHANTQAETLTFTRGGIHTEIVLPTDAIREINPDLVEHVDTDRVMVGWGDKAFFGTAKRRFFVTMKALFLPTRATVRFVPIDDAGLEEMVAVESFEATDEEVSALVDFIVYTASDARIHKREGDAVYFEARGTYFLLNTCNNWTGRALNRAGVGVASWRAWLAGGLTRQVRHRIGRDP